MLINLNFQPQDLFLILRRCLVGLIKTSNSVSRGTPQRVTHMVNCQYFAPGEPLKQSTPMKWNFIGKNAFVGPPAYASLYRGLKYLLIILHYIQT